MLIIRCDFHTRRVLRVPRIGCDERYDRKPALNSLFKATGAGEELAYRYAYPVKITRVPCQCGSPKCRGTLRYLLR
jgi:hypothetical protein